jgi:hypothetical protein
MQAVSTQVSVIIELLKPRDSVQVATGMVEAQLPELPWTKAPVMVLYWQRVEAVPR